ncbi:MAG: Lrp/AsnC family transcriptional regulator [Planctomycetota bacterium]|nr:MAG: Lrp/AsnC family transcriptional regulator [Planctomycetota bacterium]
MDHIDRKLLQEMQAAFPLAERPFAAIARAAGISEEEALARVRSLAADGILRKIGPVLDSRALGHVSTLAAMAVPEERTDEVAELLNSFDGVTHNYLREAENSPTAFNMWFTAHARDERELSGILSEIERRTSLKAMRLDAVKIYKISVHFDLSGTDED